MPIYRYHLPATSPAATAVRRRCASALADVRRYPISATDVRGAVAYSRARSERTRSRNCRSNAHASLVIEVDLPADAEGPARRADVPMPIGAADMRHWLSFLARDHAADDCIVGYGGWGDGRLAFEDRGPDKLIVEVVAPAGWTVPPEWEGAVDVSDDPAWSRPLLTRKSWPTLGLRPVPDQPASAWGAPLDPPPTTCDDTEEAT